MLKCNNYGIKAYGKVTTFATKKEYENYLMDWIMGTEGAEQDRAVMALQDLRCGIHFTDTDTH